MKRALTLAVLLACSVIGLPAARTLDIYVVDTEGGKALIVVSPSGHSMLVDAGYPGHNDRDAQRIEAAARAAGVTRFDVLVVTHYDLDHVHNVPATVARVPAVTFVDHGEPVVSNDATAAAFAAYRQLAARARHLVVKPGDRIPLPGVDVLVVTSAFDRLAAPVAGGGAANPFCADMQPRTWPQTDEDVSENAASVGLLYTFGAFRMLDLADLTWNKEIALMCPASPLGTVDLLMVSHHGFNASNSPALVKAVRPRVTIMNNGERKVGSPEVVRLLKTLPGVEANYQLHWSANAPDDNPPGEYLANLQGGADGHWIKVSVEPGGPFTVTNARTGQSRIFRK